MRRPLQGDGGAAAWCREVHLSGILTQSGNKEEQATGRQVHRQARRQQNTRLQGKHGNMRQGGKNTGVLATQAKAQSTKAKYRRARFRLPAETGFNWET